jgi:hypothetical protein
MSGNRGRDLGRFDTLLSRHFVLTVSMSVGICLLLYTTAISAFGVSVDTLGKAIDSIFKMIAVLVGAAWVLNRHYVGRTDALQIRIDPLVDIVASGASDSSSSLLLYRLDVVNTGRRQLIGYRLMIEIASVELGATGDPEYYEVATMPWHEGAPIEPGSWAAVSNVVTIGAEVKVVRITVVVEAADGQGWTWHQMFKIQSSSI